MKSYNVTILSKIAWNAPDWARPIKIDTSGNTLNTSLHLFEFFNFDGSLGKFCLEIRFDGLKEL